MNYTRFAGAAVRLIQRVPTVVWAAWILGVVVTTGFMALQGGPIH
jgi:hypothetical protein